MTTTKKKLCWNCEGSVARDALNCPYCGVYLRRDEDNDDYEDEEDAITPPYRIESFAKNAVPQAPYATPESAAISTTPVAESKPILSTKTLNDWKTVFIPLLLLLSGSIFLVFGMILLLFSSGGLLTVQWRGSLWIWYLVLALPLLYFGWRTLKNLDES
jgi:hypothetical protein